MEAGEFDGLMTFFSSFHVIRAEKVMRQAGYRVSMVPAPREFTSNCGNALCFEYVRRAEALALLAQRKVEVEAVHALRPAHQETLQRSQT